MPDLTIQVIRRINFDDKTFSGLKEARRIRIGDIIDVRDSSRRGVRQASGKYIGDHAKDRLCYYVHLTGVPADIEQTVRELPNPLLEKVLPSDVDGKLDTVDPDEVEVVRQHAHRFNFSGLPPAIQRAVNITGQATISWEVGRPLVLRKVATDPFDSTKDGVKAAVS